MYNFITLLWNSGAIPHGNVLDRITKLAKLEKLLHTNLINKMIPFSHLNDKNCYFSVMFMLMTLDTEVN